VCSAFICLSLILTVSAKTVPLTFSYLSDHTPCAAQVFNHHLSPRVESDNFPILSLDMEHSPHIVNRTDYRKSDFSPYLAVLVPFGKSLLTE